MVSGLEKIIRHFIDGKEYSPGLFIKIVEVEKDIYDNIRVVFDIDNQGNVPYNLVIVGINLKDEIEKYSEYISFEPNDIIVSYVKQNTKFDIFYVYGSIPFNQILHITNPFKSELLENLQDVTKLPLTYHHGKKEDLELIGKFIPRVNVSEFRDELFLNITFRVVKTTPTIEYDLKQLEGDVDEEFINNDLPEYVNIRNAVTATFDKWSRNFYLDNTNNNIPYWMETNFRISINLV